MRAAFALLVLAVGGAAAPACAQTYYSAIAGFRNGQGYAPATVVAGWERDASFTVICHCSPDERRISRRPASPAAGKPPSTIVGPRERPEGGR